MIKIFYVNNLKHITKHVLCQPYYCWLFFLVLWNEISQPSHF